MASSFDFDEQAARVAAADLLQAERDARLAVQQLLIETLEGLELEWPEADFDVAEQRRRLTEETPPS